MKCSRLIALFTLEHSYCPDQIVCEAVNQIQEQFYPARFSLRIWIRDDMLQFDGDLI